MSNGINKVILIGNLGRDPEMRHTQGGTPVASLNIATTRKWKNKQTNELMEETEWHRVSVFGRTAEACANHLAKGRQVYVEGRLHTRSYDDKDGIKRYATEVIAETVQFLGSGGREGGGAREGGGYGQSQGPRSQSGGGRPSGGGGLTGPVDDYDPGQYEPTEFDDSIPF